MLSGARSLYAIHQWGRCQDEDTVAALEFTHPKTPAVSCLHRVFRGMNVTAFEAALAQWSRKHLAPDSQGRVAIAVDVQACGGFTGRN